MTVTLDSRHQGLLGTVLDVRVEALTEAVASDAVSAVVEEVRRLESVFSVFDPESQLSYWKRGDASPGVELTEVLSEALEWQRRSRGAFNPEIGSLFELWNMGVRQGRIPEDGDLDEAVEKISTPGYVVGPGGVDTCRSMRWLNLNAIAKGWIVDQAASGAVAGHSVAGVMVNAGGDLLNLGLRPVVVGIEDPMRPYDNVPPIAKIGVDPGYALATSGGARRGWRIGGSWFSHVIDPRTGHPTDHIRSATALAPNAATADVLATVLAVLEPDEGLEYAARMHDVACLLVTSDGHRVSSESWDALAVS